MEEEETKPLGTLEIHSVTSSPQMEVASHDKTPKLSTIQLIIFTYFWTVGGPFGIESAVQAGGPLYTLIGLVIISLVWCLPQGLLSAELSLMTNANGGGVIWVQRAFGDFVGFVSAHASVIVNIANQSVLVVLVVNYINSAVVLEEWLKWTVRVALVTLITLINIQGLEWVSKLSGPLALLVFIPFVTEIIMIPILRKKVYWEKLLVYPYREKWGSRGFTDIAFTFTDTLGYSMIVAAVLSQFGQLNAVLASTAQQIWAMAKGKNSEVAAHRYLPYFFSYTYKRNIPVVAIVFISFVTLALSALNYEILIQLYLFLRLITLYSEYLALIYLKWKEPDTPRPYSVPGGKAGAILCFLPTLAIGMTAVITADHMALILGGALTLGIVLSYFVKLLWVYLTHEYDCCRSSNVAVDEEAVIN